MRTFTAFRGISPAGSRYRHVDDPFSEMRRRLYGEQTMDRDDRELTVPSANISEQDREGTSGYLIEMAAPGYERDDFHINVHDEILTIKAELDNDRTRDHDSFSRREHNYHSFSRAFSLPESVDEDNISATYRNGVLDIFVPVLKPVEETREPRRIAVS
ncbi:MAG: Hsp20/alpha crystallin family protein [Saprospiraceae bacterium]